MPNFVSFAHGLKGLEFLVEFVDILPARRNMDFPDVRLDSPDGFPLECRNLPKSLLRISHSELDLRLRISGAKS